MKFIQPTVITAEYKLSTPMFLGDAFQEADATVLRNASIKGALRFWWRALNWGRLLASHGGDQAAALKALHQREGELFGRASDNKNSAQSLVQISSELEGSTLVASGAQPQNLIYLLGQGLYSHNDKGPAGKKGTQRPYLSGGRLTLEVRLKPQASPDDVASVRQALTALGLFGGLGSRARKGFGSLALQWLEQAGVRETLSDLAAVEAFVRKLDFSAPSDAPLTALTTDSRLEAVPCSGSPLQALALIGQQLQLYRDGTVVGHERQSNFRGDRKLALRAARGETIAELPRRAVFGLPHNYFWKDTKEKLEIAPAESTRNRRASPLLVHIHEFPNGQCAAIQLLLPGRFLPDNTPVELKGKRNRLLDAPQVDYQVIHRYLDGFKQRKVLRDAR